MTTPRVENNPAMADLITARERNHMGLPRIPPKKPRVVHTYAGWALDFGGSLDVYPSLRDAYAGLFRWEVANPRHSRAVPLKRAEVQP